MTLFKFEEKKKKRKANGLEWILIQAHNLSCPSHADPTSIFFIPYIIRIRKLSIDDEVKSLNVKTRTKMDKCLVIPFLET